MALTKVILQHIALDIYSNWLKQLHPLLGFEELCVALQREALSQSCRDVQDKKLVARPYASRISS